jgi:hypothetical protein
VGVPVATTKHGPFDATQNAIDRSLHDVPVIAISHSQASTADDVRIAAVIHHGIDVSAVPEGRGRGGFAASSADEPGRGSAGSGADRPRRRRTPDDEVREPAERECFDAEVKPHLCSGVEYVGELRERDKLELDPVHQRLITGHLHADAVGPEGHPLDPERSEGRGQQADHRGGHRRALRVLLRGSWPPRHTTDRPHHIRGSSASLMQLGDHANRSVLVAVLLGIFRREDHRLTAAMTANVPGLTHFRAPPDARCRAGDRS